MNIRVDETWHRLREWTYGQTPSERLASQILLSEGYQNLDPSHPLGGRDGRKDALCRKDGQLYVMAVYFARGEQRFIKIENKFRHDLEGVTKNSADALAFVTNQELRLAERRNLERVAGHIPIELFHLERIATILDQPNMHSVRKQYLHIDSDNNEDAISAQRILRLNIQQHCNLLEQLIAQEGEKFLPEKWRSCLSENREVWRNAQSQMLLARSISDETMLNIQNFYEQLNSIEEECQNLLEMKAMVIPLMEKKKQPGGGVLVLATRHPPDWAKEYMSIQDETNIMGSKKLNSIMLKRLKSRVQAVLDDGNRLVSHLKELMRHTLEEMT